MTRSAAQPAVDRLTAEHLVEPLGLGDAPPRLGWRVTGCERQLAWRVESEPPRAWDSGWVAGSRTQDHRWGGPPLRAGDAVRWRVRVRTDAGEAGAEARFEVGPVAEADWLGADWRCLPRGHHSSDDHRPWTHLRTRFALPSPAVRARLHVTGLGVVVPSLNGERVGDDRFAPGWTDYRARVRYRTHDVTELLREGDNVLGALVGDGWWSGYLAWSGRREHDGRHPAVRALLVAELADGARVAVRTGPGWQARTGAVLAGDLLMGEVHDARLHPHGWDDPLGAGREAGGDDGGWVEAWPVEPPAGRVVPTPCPPVRVVRLVEPVAVTTPLAGSSVVDLGEEVAGWARLRSTAPAGTVVRLRFAERLVDGRLWTENLRGARCTDTVVLPGGEHVFEPESTYRGFRYVEVTGAPPDVVGVAVRSDVRATGELSCSDDRVQRLWHAVRRTVEANLVSLPTDCPQRDERLGWLADAEVPARTTSFLFDVGDLLAAWLEDVRSSRLDDGAFPDVAPRRVHLEEGSPGWADAGVLLPWHLWQWYGDDVALRAALPSVVRWLDLLAAANPDRRWRARRGADHGDWLAPVETPKDVVADAYWAWSAAVGARSAAVLGDRVTAGRLHRLAGEVRAAFRAEHGTRCGGTQTGRLLALAHDLLPCHERPQVAAELAADVERSGLTTGFLGVRHLLPQLTRWGRADLAHDVLLSEDEPGWLWMLANGATTTWERWDALSADGFLNSWCHVALGSVADWLHADLAGLARDPRGSGWERLLVRPQVDRLDAASAAYDGRSGRAAVAWERDGHDVRLVVEVPPGASARVELAGCRRQVGPGRHELHHRLVRRRTSGASVEGRASTSQGGCL